MCQARAMHAFLRAGIPGTAEIYFIFLLCLPPSVVSSSHCVDNGFRPAAMKLHEALGCTRTEDVNTFLTTDKDFSSLLKRAKWSRDGKHGYHQREYFFALLCGTLSLASANRMDLSFLEALPEPESPLLRNVSGQNCQKTSARQLVAEVSGSLAHSIVQINTHTVSFIGNQLRCSSARAASTTPCATRRRRLQMKRVSLCRRD